MTESSARPGKGDHVLTLCHMLANRIGRTFVNDMARHDVTIAEWRVLLTLALHGQATGKQITSRWAMDKMAVNRAIASLEKRGLLEKQRDGGDRRVVNLSLTAEGRVLYDTLLPAANARYHELMAGLERDEARQLRDILVKMIAHADSLAD